MDLIAAILEEHSKNQTDSLVTWVGCNEERTAQLLHLLLQGEYLVAQRASWIVSSVAAQHPQLMNPYIPALVEKLQDKKVHVAVRRHIYRLLQYTELPETIHGDLMNTAFEALADHQEAPAVRAFAMTTLARLTLVYPELGNELQLIIEDTLQHDAAPSFKSRARKVLQQMKRRKTSRDL